MLSLNLFKNLSSPCMNNHIMSHNIKQNNAILLLYRKCWLLSDVCLSVFGRLDKALTTNEPIGCGRQSCPCGRH